MGALGALLSVTVRAIAALQGQATRAWRAMSALVTLPAHSGAG